VQPAPNRQLANTIANAPLALVGQTVLKTLMPVTQIPAKMERHAHKALVNTHVLVLLVMVATIASTI
tara:strand:+ start:264 stop:464 length:201 start_codon:yes stop_codon:yes gene_type:complete